VRATAGRTASPSGRRTDRAGRTRDISAAHPATVAWLRLLFGAAAPALVPAARTPLRHKRDRFLVAVLGLIWMPAPFTVFAVAELTALVVLTPAGLMGLNDSTPTPGGRAAMAALGALSTGIAFAVFITLICRGGAARASVTVYLVPVVASVIGAGVPCAVFR